MISGTRRLASYAALLVYIPWSPSISPWSEEKMIYVLSSWPRFFECVEDLADLVVDEFGGGAVLAAGLGDFGLA